MPKAPTWTDKSYLKEKLKCTLKILLTTTLHFRGHYQMTSSNFNSILSSVTLEWVFYLHLHTGYHKSTYPHPHTFVTSFMDAPLNCGEDFEFEKIKICKRWLWSACLRFIVTVYFDQLKQGWPNPWLGSKIYPPRLFHVPFELFSKLKLLNLTYY